ncbi:reverse transcriptase domain-containing protein [Tanacetum coccineum]
MKECIAELPMVTVPKPKEELIMYLCVAREAVSAILLTERDSRQVPVYFVSRALQTPEINYNSMEKLVLALVHATRRLRRYFQAHPVVVITDQPIKQIQSRPKNTGRMLKWKFELEAFNITYRPRTSIRGQILVDFIAERLDEEGPLMKVQPEEATPEPWTLFTNRFQFDASNNKVEYEALMAGLRIEKQMGLKNLAAKVDSHLVVNQINGLYKAKEQSMTQYLEKTKTLINSFEIFSIEQVSQSENKKADALSKITSTSFTHLTKEESEILVVVEEEGHCWMTPLVEYLAEGTLAAKMKKARALKIKIGQYAMINHVLYRKSFLEPWLRFGLPREIISDNGSQFKDNPFKDWCEKLNIRQRFASVKHPQTNGQIERANRNLGDGIKARLGKDNRNWVEEVPHMLWAYHTMIKTSNRDIPLPLTYGTEVVIPVEIRMPSIRCAEVNQAENDKELLLNLDILEERREKEAVHEARNKAKIEKYYNAKVHGTSFYPGDFVYRSNKECHAKESRKLDPKWEGPYEVVEALEKGVYKLRNGSEDVLPRTWNIQDLKKCYL